MASAEAQVDPAAKPAEAATPGLRITGGKLAWHLEAPCDKPAAARSKDTGGGSGGNRAATSPAQPQQPLRPTTSTAASQGSKQPRAGQDPHPAGKPSSVQVSAGGQRPAPAPATLQPGQPASGVKRLPLSKPAPAPSQLNGASSKPMPALVAAVAVAGASAGASGRPPKRLKAMLVQELVTTVTLSDSSSESSSESGGSDGSVSGSDSASAGEPESEEADVAAATAWEVGLNGAGLVPDEAGLLPPGASEAAYVRARNLVLARWRQDVSRRLSEAEALGCVAAPDRPYALAAYRFLTAMGFINFGVSPDQQRHLAEAPEGRGSVVVVGAGCAGLAAARQLRAAGYRVVVVEGRDRPGGRVWTERLEGEGAAAVADIGGSIITGIDGNPLAVLCKQMRWHLADIRSDTPLFYSDGCEPPKALDEAVEALHNALLDECTLLKQTYEKTGGDTSLGLCMESLWDSSKGQLVEARGRGGPAAARRLFDWHMANLEFANSAAVESLSLRHWDQDDPNEMMGAHCFLPGCNARWVRELCRQLPIFYGSPVREVRHCATGVEVQTGQHLFKADAVVVTVPLGVLKRGDEALRFSPPLSSRKRGAIQRLGFGTMNKVILLFPFAFWSDQLDMFGHVAGEGSDRGEAFLFYSYTHISGGALLVALYSGEAAAKLEEQGAGEAARRVMVILRTFFEKRGVEVPAPLQVMTTRWGRDPMAYGSYSSMAVGTHGGPDYDCLAESVGGRVFFAGEATTRKYPATMHGAFVSGLEVAANVDATLRRASAARQAGGKAAAPAASQAREQAAAAGQAEQAAAELDGRLRLAADLEGLFRDPERPPDLEAGCTAAVHAPPPPGSSSGEAEEGTEARPQRPAQQSLLRIDWGAVKGGARRGLGPRFLVVARAVAEALADAPSNDARLALLEALPEWRHAGRQHLQAAALAQAVRQARQRSQGAAEQPEARAPPASSSLAVALN